MMHFRPLLTPGEYLGFATDHLAIFLTILLLPAIVLVIDRRRPIDPKRLKHWRRWVVLDAFAAALVLPIAPDFVSQLMLAIPVVVFYELSIWVLVWQHARRNRRVHPPSAPPGPPRLPMAIAVPNRPRAKPAPAMEPVRARRRPTIDLRPKH
jgi:Sec-independent protein secretion pathway component TatC